MKKTIFVIYQILIFAFSITSKTGKAFITVDKCGCNHNIPNMFQYYSDKESRGYSEFLKDQIHFFHRQWIYNLHLATTQDKQYHVYVKDIKSKPIYSEVIDETKIIFDKNNTDFHGLNFLLKQYEQITDLKDKVVKYFNDHMSSNNVFITLYGQAKKAENEFLKENTKIFFIVQYIQKIIEIFSIELVDNVLKLEKSTITEKDAYLFWNLALYLKSMNEKNSVNAPSTLAYEVEVVLRDNQKELKRKFYLIYSIKFVRGAASSNQYNTSVYYIDQSKKDLKIDNIKNIIHSAKFLKNDLKTRKELLKTDAFELKIFQTYKYPGFKEFQTSCVFAGAGLRVAITFIISALMRDNFGNFFYCGQTSLMRSFSVERGDLSEWFLSYEKIKPNYEPYEPEVVKEEIPVIVEEDLDNKDEQDDENIKKKSISVEKEEKEEKEVIDKKISETISSDEPSVSDESNKKSTENNKKKTDENLEKEKSGENISEEEGEIELKRVILKKPIVEPELKEEHVQINEKDEDFFETIEIELEQPIVNDDTEIKFTCEDFYNSINESQNYPEDLTKLIYEIRNLSFISFYCSDEPNEDESISIGFIKFYDDPILKMIFYKDGEQYCFEIDGETMIFSNTYFICFNEISKESDEISFIKKQENPFLYMNQRIYGPVLNAFHETVMKLSKMKSTLIVPDDVFNYLIKIFFEPFEFNSFRNDLLKDIPEFVLTKSFDTFKNGYKIERNLINEKGLIYWLTFEKLKEIKIMIRIFNANEDFLKLSIGIGETFFDLFIPRVFSLNQEEEDEISQMDPIIPQEQFYIQKNYLTLIANYFKTFVDKTDKILPSLNSIQNYHFNFETLPVYIQQYFVVNYSDFTLLFTSITYILSKMTYGDENQKLYDVFIGNLKDDEMEFIKDDIDNDTWAKFEQFFKIERNISLDASEDPKKDDIYNDEDDNAENESTKTSFIAQNDITSLANDLIASPEHEDWIYITNQSELKHYDDFDGIIDQKKIFFGKTFNPENDEEMLNSFLEKLYYYLRTKSEVSSENKFSLIFGNKEIKRYMLFEAWGYEMTNIKAFHINLFSLYFNTQFIIQNSTFSFDLERLFELIAMTSNHFKDIILSAENFDIYNFNFDMDKIKECIDELIGETDIVYHEMPELNEEDIEEGVKKEKSTLTYFIPKYNSKVAKTDISDDNILTDFKLAIVVKKKSLVKNKSGYVIKVYDNKMKEDNAKNVLTSEYEFYRSYPYDFKPIFMNYISGIIKHFKTGKLEFTTTPKDLR